MGGGVVGAINLRGALALVPGRGRRGLGGWSSLASGSFVFSGCSSGMDITGISGFGGVGADMACCGVGQVFIRRVTVAIDFILACGLCLGGGGGGVVSIAHF